MSDDEEKACNISNHVKGVADSIEEMLLTISATQGEAYANSVADGLNLMTLFRILVDNSLPEEAVDQLMVRLTAMWLDAGKFHGGATDDVAVRTALFKDVSALFGRTLLPSR